MKKRQFIGDRIDFFDEIIGEKKRGETTHKRKIFEFSNFVVGEVQCIMTVFGRGQIFNSGYFIS